MKKLIVILCVFLVSSFSLFSAVKVYKGTYKDHGTHSNGDRWVGCWTTQSVCFYTKSKDIANPNQIDHVWVPDTQQGWTNIENPHITNHNDPSEGDFKNLNFEIGNDTQEHSDYASWEQEATNP